MRKHILISLWLLLVVAIMFPSFAAAAFVSGPEWSIVGRGDFNGDATPDILWRNETTGGVVVWYMNGVNVISEQKIKDVPDATWKIAGVGDFNGDGNPDILLRNSTTGETVVWFIRGTTVTDTASIYALPPFWHIVAVGDFNGDGSPEILWRNSATGEVIEWFMSGTTVRDIPLIAALQPSLNLEGAWDSDGYKAPDIIWVCIAAVLSFRPQIDVGVPASLGISSLHIRAPPTFPIYSYLT
jgi:hypothetical protein